MTKPKNVIELIYMLAMPLILAVVSYIIFTMIAESIDTERFVICGVPVAAALVQQLLLPWMKKKMKV